MKYAQGALTRKQVEHEIKKIAETEVRTSLGIDQITGQQLSNQAQRQENRFNADTYKSRVKTVEEALWNLMHDSDSAGLGKFVGRVIRPFMK